jgi:hypothetical protein
VAEEGDPIGPKLDDGAAIKIERVGNTLQRSIDLIINLGNRSPMNAVDNSATSSLKWALSSRKGPLIMGEMRLRRLDTCPLANTL